MEKEWRNIEVTLHTVRGRRVSHDVNTSVSRQRCLFGPVGSLGRTVAIYETRQPVRQGGHLKKKKKKTLGVALPSRRSSVFTAGVRKKRKRKEIFDYIKGPGAWQGSGVGGCHADVTKRLQGKRRKRYLFILEASL